MKDKLLIYSGGMDSTTLLYDQAESIGLAVSFNYGSNHAEKELAMAAKNCEKLGIKHIVINMQEAFKDIKSGLTSGADNIPEGHYAEDSMKDTVVPFRNGIMLSVAAGIADSNGLKYVMLASHAGDHAVYPDCRPSFNTPMFEAIYNGTENGVSVLAPYADITKRDIALRGKALGIDYANDTWSCYKANSDKHCGRCSTCVERIWALRDIDDTEYVETEFAIQTLKDAGEW